MTSPVQAERSYVAQTLSRYWPGNDETILHLPFPIVDPRQTESLPPRLEWVELPEWASQPDIENKMLVPAAMVVPGNLPAWERTDWLGTAFWFLACIPEREHERLFGPVHSYSIRLEGWNEALWQRAWVNRIAIFLRRCVSKIQKCDEVSRLGPMPKAQLLLTHDVDAVTHTLAIEFKQAAFNLFNSLRLLVRGEPGEACRRVVRAARFLLSINKDYNQVDRVMELESKRGLKSCFHFYGGAEGWRRNLKQLLMDPAYDIEGAELKRILEKIIAEGFEIGLHPSFDSWENAGMIGSERSRLERACALPVSACRQHWFRFSWERTWQAQQDAGLLHDSTLGFNDRPGFRNSAALRMHPWDPTAMRPMHVESIPTVFMDSQFYDYELLNGDERRREMGRWIDEVRAVGGTAAVLWHPHTLSRDFGWEPGFEELLNIIADRTP